MNRTIVYTLLGCCLIGLTSAGIAFLNAKVSPPIAVRTQDVDSLVDGRVLQAEADYDLFVMDSTAVAPDDPLTWFIQKRELTGPKFESFQLNEPVRELTFRDTGYYDVRAYLHMKEVGASILHVVDGDRFDVDWGNGLELIQGSSFQFNDRSTNVADRKWVVRRSITDEEVASSEDVRFEWMPTDTGTYTVRVKIETRSGKVNRDERTVTVVTAPPEPVAEVKPVVKPAWKPKEPWKPKETTPAPPSNSSACYVIGKKLEGSNFWVEVDKPERSQVQFSNEPTTFTISPIYDCIFAGFDYFADSKIDNIEITIQCTSKTCSGKPIWSTRVKGAYDAHKEVSANFTSPVLNKDYQYLVTVKPLAPGKLGYFETKGNKFTNEKKGSAFRSKDVSLQIHDLKTCIYHLRFTR